MKKILVISNYRGLHIARPEAEIFVGLAIKGFDITIMTHSDSEYISRFEESGIKVIPQHPVEKKDIEFIKIIRKELREGGYDILHLFNNKAISNGLKAAKGLDVKVVIYRGASANMAWWNPLNYFKFFHPRIDYAVCNSEEIRKKFLAVPFYKESKAITIIKGHNVDWYADTIPYDIRTELCLSQKSLLFVTVANNRGVKGIPVLLKAMKLIDRDAEIDLLIIGNKMERSPIPHLIKNSGQVSKIHLLGYRKDALNIVAASDSIICPSTGSEALTKSVVEAMSLGVVPIISDIPGNKPLVDDNVNGFIFRNRNFEELAQRMMDIYRNKHVLSDFGTAAKRKIQRDVNRDDTVRRYSEFYMRIT